MQQPARNEGKSNSHHLRAIKKKNGINFATSRGSEIEWTTSETFNHFPFCQSSWEVLAESFLKAPAASRGWMFQAKRCADLVGTRPTPQRCFASTTSSTWARRPRSCIGRWSFCLIKLAPLVTNHWSPISLFPVSTSQRAFHNVLHNQEDNALYEVFQVRKSHPLIKNQSDIKGTQTWMPGFTVLT